MPSFTLVTVSTPCGPSPNTTLTLQPKRPSIRKGKRAVPLPAYTIYAQVDETVVAAEPIPVGHDVAPRYADAQVDVESPPPYAAEHDLPPYEPLAPSLERLDIYRCGGEVCPACSAGTHCVRHPHVGYPEEMIARCPSLAHFGTA